MDEVTDGLMPSYLGAPYDPLEPWHRPVNKTDGRNSSKGAGRRMRNPFLPHIAYKQNPDKTINFGYDRLRKTRSVLTRTLESTAVQKYMDNPDDVIIKELWLAQQLSTFTEMFHAFHTYLRTVLPFGRNLGWQPRDLSPKNYFIELLDVTVGSPDEAIVEELGTSRPYLMREQLSVTFKLLREIQSPSGVIVATGF